MNRAMKRQSEREKLKVQKEPTITIRRSEMMKIISDETKKAAEIVQKEAMEKAVRDLTSAYVLTHYFLGWSKEMIHRFLEVCSNTMQSVDKGKFTIDDIKHTCEHYDLDFEVIYGRDE